MTVRRKLSDLHTWDDNPHEGDVGALTKDIAKFGYNRSIAVWEDGKVMAGNHTYQALLTLYREHPENVPKNVFLDDATGEWEIDTHDITHLTYEQAKAYALADNRMSELGRDDPEQLATLLQDIALSEDKELLEATGYDGDDLDDLLKKVAGDVLLPPDEFPEYGEDIDTDYCCPKCGYEWSGSPK